MAEEKKKKKQEKVNKADGRNNKPEEKKEKDVPVEEKAEAEMQANENAAELNEESEKKAKVKKKKSDRKDEEMAKLAAYVEDLNDRLKRNLAEFDNFRKRSEKEKSQMFDIGAKAIIEVILPVVDNFERGLATLDEKTMEEDPFAVGMEKTYKQLIKALEDAGVKEIECLGQEFNADLHNAVMHEDNPELGENVVSEVFQKGYTYHDSVVRHSMVKVAN